MDVYIHVVYILLRITPYRPEFGVAKSRDILRCTNQSTCIPRNSELCMLQEIYPIAVTSVAL